MKFVSLILIVLVLGTLSFGQSKRKKRTVKSKTTVQALPNTSKDKETSKSSTLNETKWVVYKELKVAELYYDPSSVVRNGSLVKVWTKRIVKDDNSYQLVLEEINCMEHQYRMLQYNAYNQNGLLIKSVVPDQSATRASNIIPDSISQTLETKVCKVVK